MQTKTGIKIFFLALFIVWAIFVISIIDDAEIDTAEQAIFFITLCIIAPIAGIVSLSISIANDRGRINEARNGEIQKLEIGKKQISLTRKILTVVASNDKPLSVYDFMIRIQESEEKIENELEMFVERGLAEKLINEKGLTLYKFSLIPPEKERADILS